MAIQTFNETFLGNADVPQTGSIAGAGPTAQSAKATGMPSAVQSFDPAANLRTNAVTKQAGPRTVSGGNTKTPKNVSHFNGETV